MSAQIRVAGKYLQISNGVSDNALRLQPRELGVKAEFGQRKIVVPVIEVTINTGRRRMMS